ncbi:MAG: arylsulfatase [Cyclobacteriaceae bacterium]|nr:arylsulfatase [Cyclobacteriaceae bacterium]
MTSHTIKKKRMFLKIKSLKTLCSLVFAVSWLMLVTGCQEKEQQGSDPPNIIIIFADDMGYGDVSALNPLAKTRTPYIDRLIEQSLVFTEAHSSASVCTPSRYGLLTGKYAFRHAPASSGIWGFHKPVIESERETMASLLKKAGYQTACIGKWHLGLDWKTRDGSAQAALDSETGYSNVDYSQAVHGSPNDYGFDYSFIHPASLDIPPYLFLRNGKAIDAEMILTTDHYPARLEHTVYSWDKKHTDEKAVYWEKGVWWRQGEMSVSFRVEDCHSEILKEAREYINRQSKETPFFLYLPLTGPHTPWMPTPAFEGKSGIGKYGDFVFDIDDAVKQVSEALKMNNLDKNTMIVFASDNGAYWPQEEIELHNHDSNEGRRGQKGDVWDGGHRVPLIIHWPAGIEKSMLSHQLVSLTDLFATFAELIGVTPEPCSGEDSYSFYAALNGEVDMTIRPEMIHHSSRGMYAIRKGDWKYIDGLGSGGFTHPAVEAAQDAGPQGQLYHLATDPGEMNNVYLNYPEIVRELKSLLEHEKSRVQ